MIVTIYYDRLYSDGSLMDENYWVYENNDWDIGKIPDIIAKFFNDNITYNTKITKINIERNYK